MAECVRVCAPVSSHCQCVCWQNPGLASFGLASFNRGLFSPAKPVQPCCFSVFDHCKHPSPVASLAPKSHKGISTLKDKLFYTQSSSDRLVFGPTGPSWVICCKTWVTQGEGVLPSSASRSMLVGLLCKLCVISGMLCLNDSVLQLTRYLNPTVWT